MIEAVRNLHGLGVPLEDALRAASEVPARVAQRGDLDQLRARTDAGDEYAAYRAVRLLADRGARGAYHFNGITSWSVAQGGEVKHVYA